MGKKIIIFLILTILQLNLKSQTCSVCNISLNQVDSSNYIITSGQTLCLDSNAVFTGTITINGGVVCNKGLINPKQFNFQSGTILNYTNISLTSSLNVGANCVLEIKDGATLNLNNAVLSLSGGQIENNGVISVIGTINVNSGAFNNMNLINSSVLNGAASINNSGIINTN